MEPRSHDANGTSGPATNGTHGIDPAEMANVMRVLAQLDELPIDHPDAVAVRRATAGLYKIVKKRRRSERREVVIANDDAVTSATATGAPGRIDDETRGLPLVSSTIGATAGTLLRPRACYICKQRYLQVDAFYHQLCPTCAGLNHERRTARTDLSSRRALLTGGRAKIGMYIALRLLRDGAHTTITTRFPRDAARRFAAMPDASEWMNRLRIVGIDLRNPAQVVRLADSVALQGPLDILINNAAQTVRRSPGAYAHLVEAESAPLPPGDLPEVISFGSARAAHPTLLTSALTAGGTLDPAELAGGEADVVQDARGGLILGRTQQDERFLVPAGLGERIAAIVDLVVRHALAVLLALGPALVGLLGAVDRRLRRVAHGAGAVARKHETGKRHDGGGGSGAAQPFRG